MRVAHCPRCEGTLFIPVLKIKDVSKDRSGREIVADTDYLKCVQCGELIHRNELGYKEELE